MIILIAIILISLKLTVFADNDEPRITTASEEIVKAAPDDAEYAFEIRYLNKGLHNQGFTSGDTIYWKKVGEKFEYWSKNENKWLPLPVEPSIPTGLEGARFYSGGIEAYAIPQEARVTIPAAGDGDGEGELSLSSVPSAAPQSAPSAPAQPPPQQTITKKIAGTETTLTLVDYQTGGDNFVYRDSRTGKFYTLNSAGEINALAGGSTVFKTSTVGNAQIRTSHMIEEGKPSAAVTSAAILSKDGTTTIQDNIDAYALSSIRTMLQANPDATLRRIGSDSFVLERENQVVGRSTRQNRVYTTESNFIRGIEDEPPQPGRRFTVGSDFKETNQFTHTYTVSYDEGATWQQITAEQASSEQTRAAVEAETAILQQNYVHTQSYRWQRSQDGSYRDAYQYNWQRDESGRETHALVDIYDEGRFVGVGYLDPTMPQEDPTHIWRPDKDDLTEQMEREITARRRAVKFETFETVLTDFQGLSYYSPHWFGEDEVAEWREGVDRVFDNAILGGKDYWLSALCLHEYESSGDESFYFVTPEGQIVQLATVQGERSSEMPKACPCNEDKYEVCKNSLCYDEGGSQINEYFYKITFTAKTTYEDNTFMVYLKPRPADYKLHADLPGAALLSEWVSLEGNPNGNGAAYYATGSRAIVQYSENYYTDICIRFSKGLNIGRGFLGAASTENELCNVIEQSDSSWENYHDSEGGGAGAGSLATGTVTVSDI